MIYCPRSVVGRNMAIDRYQPFDIIRFGYGTIIKGQFSAYRTIMITKIKRRMRMGVECHAVLLNDTLGDYQEPEYFTLLYDDKVELLSRVNVNA